MQGVVPRKCRTAMRYGADFNVPFRTNVLSGRAVAMGTSTNLRGLQPLVVVAFVVHEWKCTRSTS
jgi:hypothetical protein